MSVLDAPSHLLWSFFYHLLTYHRQFPSLPILPQLYRFILLFRRGLELMGSDQLLLHFRLISTHKIPDSSSSSSSCCCCCCCWRCICNYTKKKTDTKNWEKWDPSIHRSIIAAFSVLWRDFFVIQHLSSVLMFLACFLFLLASSFCSGLSHLLENLGPGGERRCMPESITGFFEFF